MLILNPPARTLDEVPMSYNRIFRTLCLLFVAMSFFALHLAAQDAPSVAEAARRSREQKQAASKPATVVTNDTLSPLPATAPAAATAANAPAASSASPESSAENQPPASSNDAEKKKADIDALKQQIADKQQAADLLQREISLERDTFYSNPDYQHDTSGKQKLDSMQSDLKDMQDELATLKAKLADLSGGEEPKESAPANPPATQPANPPATPAPPQS